MPQPDNTSLEDLLLMLAPLRPSLAVAMAALPCLAYAAGRALRNRAPAAARWLLAGCIYIAVLPGVCLSLSVAYLLFFTRANLFADLDVVLYYGPILCMIATLVAAGQVMRFEDIPGFQRLSGLFLLAGLSFGAAFFLFRMRILIGFFTSFLNLALLVLALFAALKLGTAKLMGRKQPPAPGQK